MKKIKKTLIGLLACLTVGCAAVGLGACGEESKKPASGGETNTEQGGGYSEEAYEHPIFCGSNGIITGLTEYGKTLSVLEIPTEIDGEKITSIGDSAFRYCGSLTSITIPNSVTSIGEDAFYNCDSLTYNEKDGLKYLGNSSNPYLYSAGVSSEDITSATIDANCRFIGSYAFEDCDSLTSVTIGNSVTSIEYSTFSDCDSLTSVTIGNSVTSIEDYAFHSCGSLTSITIPNSVTSIENYAFQYCYKLVEVVNKSPHITVEKGSSENGYLGYCALGVYNSEDTFATKLSNDNGCIVYTDEEEKILVHYVGEETALTLPSYITSIRERAFRGCDSLTSVTIGNSVTCIGNNAFLSCGSLTSIEIPNSVTSIGNNAFSGCDSLTSIEIPNSVTSIEHSTFSDCDSLTSVTIGNSVTSIGDSAFYNCGSLTSITFNGTVEEWYKIEKRKDWKYDVPATKVVCTDGEVEL